MGVTDSARRLICGGAPLGRMLRHPFAEDCRAGVHARRETSRQSRRFRADEITAARRRSFGGSPARSAGVRAGERPLRSTTRQAEPLRRGRCLHRPAKLPGTAMLGCTFPFSRCLPFAAMLPGGRNRPPYNTRQTAGETGNFAFAADVSFPGTHLRGAAKSKSTAIGGAAPAATHL